MRLPPAVIVHGKTDVDTVLRHGRPVTLLSGRGAAGYAGCLWWRALVAHAEAAYPDVAYPDVMVTALLDCADAGGQALAALRIGLRGLVLDPLAPGRARIEAIARQQGAVLLQARPAALDLAEYRAATRLHDWLQRQTMSGDSAIELG